MEVTKRKRRRGVQGVLPFRSHGGPRQGAGRKPKGKKAGMKHRVREPLASRYPLHVTCKLERGLPRLRRRAEHAALRDAFAKGCERFGFRLTHYAILNDHLHFVVEAKGRDALHRGMVGLLVRIARSLNKLWGRKGRVFPDRYHDRILRTPREVRNVLQYVFGNARRHAAQAIQNGHAAAKVPPVDTFTSAPWFDGFRQSLTVRGIEAMARPIARAHTWLLHKGWRRHGLIPIPDR